MYGEYNIHHCMVRRYALIFVVSLCVQYERIM